MVDREILLVLTRCIEQCRLIHGSPLVVAIDGRSGAGKSTLAAAVAGQFDDCAVIDGDQFYAGGSPEIWDARSPAESAASVIDWRRQRLVLESLRSGQRAHWYGFDWEAFDGRLEIEPTVCEPATVIVLEGVYSARPELADLIDLRVMLDSPTEVRHRRLAAREGDSYRDEWFERWSEAEEHYFTRIMPARAFDLVI